MSCDQLALAIAGLSVEAWMLTLWIMFGPVLGFLAAWCYMRVRYRSAIIWQKWLNTGLRKGLYATKQTD